MDLKAAFKKDKAALLPGLLLDGHSNKAINLAFEKLDDLNQKDGLY